MSGFVEIHGDQLKLDDIQENIEWSKQQNWKLKKYGKKDDHDHCLICYWTIYKSDHSDEGYGYFYGGSTWLCIECYDKFVKKL